MDQAPLRRKDQSCHWVRVDLYLQDRSGGQHLVACCWEAALHLVQREVKRDEAGPVQVQVQDGWGHCCKVAGWDRGIRLGHRVRWVRWVCWVRWVH